MHQKERWASCKSFLKTCNSLNVLIHQMLRITCQKTTALQVLSKLHQLCNSSKRPKRIETKHWKRLWRMTAGTAKSSSLIGWRRFLSNTGFKITTHTYWRHYHRSTQVMRRVASLYTTRLETFIGETCVKAREMAPAFTLIELARWLTMGRSWMTSITGKALCAQNKTVRPILTSTMASGLKACETV